MPLSDKYEVIAMKKKLADEIGKAYLRLHSKQGYQPQADKYMWTDATNKPIPTPPPPTSGSNEIQTAKQLRVEVLDAIEKTWGEQAINKMLSEAVKEVSK